MQQLERAIERAEDRIRHSWGAERRVAVIEIVRTMDLQSLATRPNDDAAESDKELDELYLRGYGRALCLFLDESTAKDGYPLFTSSDRSLVWAASALQHAGRVESFRRIVSLHRNGLVELHAHPGGSIDARICPGAGVEAVERNDHYWLAGLGADILAAERDRLLADQQRIDRLMLPRARKWRGSFISYDTSPEIDAHFEEMGVMYCRLLTANDSYPADAVFGGLPFYAYRAAVALLVGWSMKHIRYCSLLSNKDPTIHPVNIVSTWRHSTDLARSLAIALETGEGDARQLLQVLTLNSVDVQHHFESSSGAHPPLITIGQDFVLESAHGWQSAPFMFLLAGLRRGYRSDWDGAVALREPHFRKELYELFSWADMVTLPFACKLRLSGEVMTDIDAVMAHRPSGTVGLFQLKWQDPFGGSMRLRASRRTNFLRGADMWIDKVSRWLSERSPAERAKGLGLDRFGIHQVEATELFVLGRHFAHFSGCPADDRAAWGLWPQVLRLMETAVSAQQTDLETQDRRDLIGDPIRWLSRKLRIDAPSSRLPYIQHPEVLELSGVPLTVRMQDSSRND